MTEAIVIDDDPFICDAWAKTLGVAGVETFERVGDLWRYIEDHHNWAARLRVIILDLYLEDGISGLDLAPKIRAMLKGRDSGVKSGIPIIMCTDSFDTVTSSPAIDLVIPKEPMGIDVLLRQIKRDRAI